MTAEQLQLILILVTMGVAAFALYQSYRAGAKVTPSVVLEKLKEARPVAAQLMEIAQAAVNAVEQLRREGKISDNDIAFNHALDLVKKWVPDEWEIDNEDIISAINAAILVASALSRQAGVSSENVSTTRIS